MRRILCAGSALALPLVLATCAPDQAADPTAPAAEAQVAEPICEVLNFDNFAHGDTIRSVSMFGLNLPLYVSPGGEESSPVAIAYDTNNLHGPDDDLEWNSEYGGKCKFCKGLNRIMVFGNPYGFDKYGDGEHGGYIIIYGFTGGEYYVTNWTVVENDSYEPPVYLLADGVGISLSHSWGNGSVENPTVYGPYFFRSWIGIAAGTWWDQTDRINGSGGYDNIRICKRPAA